jgi:hypothetical protein
MAPLRFTQTALVALLTLIATGTAPGAPALAIVPARHVPVQPLNQLLDGVTALQCVPREECCKVCRKGRACGNTCIRADYNCRKGQGCACNEDDICE